MHGIEDFKGKPADVPATGAWYKELNRYQWFVLVVASLGWMFDCMDQRVFLISRQAALTDLLGYERKEGKLATHHGVALREEVTVDPSGKEVKKRIRDAQGIETGEATGLAGAWTGFLKTIGWPGGGKTIDADGEVKWYSGVATMVFMLGWATGGLYFGIMGDRWGRARTMIITILLYSAFTGLSALSQNAGDFMIYRFITGLGVGGEFAAGIALVAEAMPTRARPFALGTLQALSAVGNIFGSLLGLVVLPYGWHYMFLIGTLPALLALLIMKKLKEPESWVRARQEQLALAAAGKPIADEQKMGRLGDLFRNPRWRYNTIIGVTLAVSGVVGLWGVGFWSFELVAEALAETDPGRINTARAIGTTLQDVGAALGIAVFTAFTAKVGRKLAFGLGYLLALGASILVFGFMRTEGDVYWMLPILGFCNLMVFGGFAIYFPELYPTRLRSTGAGFCYNAARFIAALGPLLLGGLVVYYGSVHLNILSSWGGVDSPFRYAALTVAAIYLVGMVAIIFAPETKGKPLPE